MSEPRSLRSVSGHDTPAGRQPTDIPERAGEPPSYDTGIAHPARIYDYLLGGKENYEADRAAAEEIIKTGPDARPAVQPGVPAPGGGVPGRGGRDPAVP